MEPKKCDTKTIICFLLVVAKMNQSQKPVKEMNQENRKKHCIFKVRGIVEKGIKESGIVERRRRAFQSLH